MLICKTVIKVQSWPLTLWKLLNSLSSILLRQYLFVSEESWLPVIPNATCKFTWSSLSSDLEWKNVLESQFLWQQLLPYTCALTAALCRLKQKFPSHLRTAPNSITSLPRIVYVSGLHCSAGWFDNIPPAFPRCLPCAALFKIHTGVTVFWGTPTVAPLGAATNPTFYEACRILMPHACQPPFR